MQYLRQHDRLLVILYYASFIPGLQDFIAEVVRERLADGVIHRLFNGAIVFETSLGYDKLNFFCFNNIFAVINLAEDISLEEHIAAVVQSTPPPGSEAVIARNSAKFRTFRVVVSQENKPAAINEKLRVEAERYIAKISGLAVNRAKPDTEYWFLSRVEGGRVFSLFLKRLTLRPSWENSLHPGELPPPLAWTLCRMGNIAHGDTVLDPFCGYGAIPQAALKHFHITKCIACDSDKKAAAYTAARFKNRSGFTLHKADFRSLPDVLPEKSVDAVITDPPWGHYNAGRDVPTAQFYQEMFNILGILLKKDGHLVILGPRTGELSGEFCANAPANGFTLQKNIPILLSGKKAAIYCFGT